MCRPDAVRPRGAPHRQPRTRSATGPCGPAKRPLPLPDPLTHWLLSPKALFQAAEASALGCPCLPSGARRTALPSAAVRGPAETRTPPAPCPSQLAVTSAHCQHVQTVRPPSRRRTPSPRRTPCARRPLPGPRQPASRPRLSWASRARGPVHDLPRPASPTRLPCAVACRAAARGHSSAPVGVSPEGRLAVPTLRPGGRRCHERVHRCPGRARLCTPRSGSAGSHADHSGRASRPPPTEGPRHGVRAPHPRGDDSESPRPREQRGGGIARSVCSQVEQDPQDSQMLTIHTALF